MASRKPTGSKTKSKTQKPRRASAVPPNTPAPLREQAGATTMVPAPPLPGKPGPAKAAKPAAAKAQDAAQKRDGEAAPLKKQELMAQVVARSEVAKKHAKPVIEAMLDVLGEALAEGRDLNLQPMGKIKRKRMNETDTARIVVANIRQKKSSGESEGRGAPPLPGSTPGSIPGNLPGTAPTGAGAPLRHPLKEAVAESDD
ncbi:HU family DNA-binding protein [Roseovarius sp. S1116L3]|uniref:HU family DNA-binding protein n=1 Tax=Roseovarius roseus TaxID=3342636 RepID=UPI003728494C